MVDERNIDRVAQGCLKPCKYRHYRTIGSPLSSLLLRNGTLLFGVLAADYDIYTETELLIEVFHKYPQIRNQLYGL